MTYSVNVNASHICKYPIDQRVRSKKKGDTEKVSIPSFLIRGVDFERRLEGEKVASEISKERGGMGYEDMIAHVLLECRLLGGGFIQGITQWP